MGDQRRRQLEHRRLRHRHQRRQRQDDQLQDQYELSQLPDRHLPAWLLRRLGCAKGRDAATHRPAEPAGALARCCDRHGRRRQLGRLGLLERARRCRIRRLHRQARAAGRHFRREPHPVHRPRRRQPQRHRLPDLRPDLAGLQRLGRGELLWRQRPGHRPGRRARLCPQLQPADRHARRRRYLCRAAGLSVRRRVCRPLLAGTERLRRLVHGRRRCRPLWQPAAQPQNVSGCRP